MLSLSDLVHYVHWFQLSQIWMNATIHWKPVHISWLKAWFPVQIIPFFAAQ